MKNIIAAVALTALATSPAFAAGADSPQSATFGVSASIDASCGVITGTPLSFGQIQVDASGHLIDPGEVNSTPQPAFCNGVNSYLQIHAEPLVTDATPSADFTNRIDYNATALIAGTQSTGGSAADSHDGGLPGPMAFAGDLVVHLDYVHIPSGLRPIAGDYSGSVTITLTPGV